MANKEPDKMPTGILLILLYLSLGVLGIPLSLLTPKVLFFGIIPVEGILASIIQIIFGAVLVALIYGIYKRFSWAYTLAIIYFGFTLLNLITGTLRVFIDQNYLNSLLGDEITGNMRALVFTITLVTMGFMLLLNAAIMYYVLKKKNYFKN